MSGAVGGAESGGWVPLILEGVNLLAKSQQQAKGAAPSEVAHKQYLGSLGQGSESAKEEDSQPSESEVTRLLDAMGVAPEMRPLLLYGLLAQKNLGLRGTYPDYSDPAAYQTDIPPSPEENRPDTFSDFLPLNPYAGVMPPLSIPPPDDRSRKDLELLRNRRPIFPPRRWSEL